MGWRTWKDYNNSSMIWRMKNSGKLLECVRVIKQLFQKLWKIRVTGSIEKQDLCVFIFKWTFYKNITCSQNETKECKKTLSGTGYFYQLYFNKTVKIYADRCIKLNCTAWHILPK